MKQNEMKLYQTPQVEFVDLYLEGVLCSSLEDLFENQGSWEDEMEL